MKYLYAILILIAVLAYWAFGETNTVFKQGVEIKWKPVIYVTMAPNTTNTLYWSDDLMDGFEECFFLHDHIVGTNYQRMVFESSKFDEDTKAGFFKLEVDGAILTNAPAGVVSESSASAPPPVPN